MPDASLSDAAPAWIAGLVFLWIGGAAWVTAVASHLELSEWRWFGLALGTGPAAWLAVFLRLRRARALRRSSSSSPSTPAPEV